MVLVSSFVGSNREFRQWLAVRLNVTALERYRRRKGEKMKNPLGQKRG